jgi:hypothetical protein
MSNYTKSTNFATKDNLTPGDPLKIVRGTEIDTEYNNIATAIATKTDNASAAITGGTINATTIGATTASTGAFSTLSATGAITSTLATGTAPLVIASTTKVANLNVDSLDGADWASPAALGSTTPAAVSATTLTTSSTVTFNGGTANGVAYLNGSKVVTSGSALTFDGTNLATTGDISLGAGKLLKYSSTSYITPENNVSGAEISTTGVITFLTGSGTPTERARIDSSGNLLLGTTSSFSARRFRIYGSQASAASTSLQLTNSTTGDGASDGLTLEMDGVNGYLYNYESGPLIFGTANTERARIDSSGNLLVGTASAYLSTNSFFKTSGASQPTLYLLKNSSSSSTDEAFCIANGLAGGTVSFQVLANGNAQNTNNSYGAISDERLKENIVDASPKLIDLMQVRVRNFNLIADETKSKQIGVVAQELEQVFPMMIEETTQGTKSVKYSVFVPMLIKAIQELKAEFDAYKASHP